jgi:hypothetical protein
MHKSRAYIRFLNTCQLKSRKHSAKGRKANRVWPKEIHEKVSVLNITTPSLENEDRHVAEPSRAYKTLLRP